MAKPETEDLGRPWDEDHGGRQVLPFLRQSDEMLFTAPSNHHKLQADESLRAADLAEDIAHAAYNRDVCELGRREQALCRYLATHALRMTHENWKVAALGAGRGDWLCIGTSLDALGAGGASPPPAPTSQMLVHASRARPQPVIALSFFPIP